MDVPKILIEDLAKDLGVSSAVAESLVKWVIDYLNRPCCWSVGFVRLVLDLARDGRMRDVLRGLGITIGEWGVVDEGLIKLRKVLDVVIRYLERAGIVEYVKSDGVVNLLRR
jgi:hypothetical protein